MEKVGHYLKRLSHQLVSAVFAISSHIKFTINTLISAWDDVGQEQSNPGEMHSIFPLLVFHTQ